MFGDLCVSTRHVLLGRHDIAVTLDTQHGVRILNGAAQHLLAVEQTCWGVFRVTGVDVPGAMEECILTADRIISMA